jgi:hypothetical protein
LLPLKDEGNGYADDDDDGSGTEDDESLSDWNLRKKFVASFVT